MFFRESLQFSKHEHQIIATCEIFFVALSPTLGIFLALNVILNIKYTNRLCLRKLNDDLYAIHFGLQIIEEKATVSVCFGLTIKQVST